MTFCRAAVMALALAAVVGAAGTALALPAPRPSSAQSVTQRTAAADSAPLSSIDVSVSGTISASTSTQGPDSTGTESDCIGVDSNQEAASSEAWSGTEQVQLTGHATTPLFGNQLSGTMSLTEVVHETVTCGFPDGSAQQASSDATYTLNSANATFSYCAPGSWCDKTPEELQITGFSLSDITSSITRTDNGTVSHPALNQDGNDNNTCCEIGIFPTATASGAELINAPRFQSFAVEPWVFTAGAVATEYGDLEQLTPKVTVSSQGSPAARCDAYWTRPGRDLSVAAPGVLANDSSNGHGPLTPHVDHISFGISSHPYKASANGSLVFHPTLPGTAVITYHDVGSDGSASAPTTATIYIGNTEPAAAKSCSSGTADRPPVARNDYALSTGKPTTGNVLINDSDPDGDALSVTGVRQGKVGKTRCQKTGACTYTPGKNYKGKDTFSYTISDGHGKKATAKVFVLAKPSQKGDPNTLLQKQAAPPPYQYGDVGISCGKARFDWRDSIKQKTIVRKGDYDCQLILSNRASREVWTLAGQNFGKIATALVGPVAEAAAKKLVVSKLKSTLISKGLTVLSDIVPDVVGPVGAMYAVASWSNLAAEAGIIATDLNDFQQWVLDDDGCVVLDVNVSKHKVSGNLQLIPGTQSNYYLLKDSSDQIIVRTEKVFDQSGNRREFPFRCSGGGAAISQETAHSKLNDLFSTTPVVKLFNASALSLG